MSEELCCPKCGSTSLHADKKGFSVGKALLGRVLVGGIGLLGGFMGSSKVMITCLNCGYTFKPGDGKRKVSYQPINATPEPQPLPQAQQPQAELPKTVRYSCKNLRKKRPKLKPPQPTTWQHMSIETLLSYSDVIQDGRIKRLEELQNEGQTHIELRGGELELLRKTRADGKGIRIAVSLREIEE